MSWTRLEVVNETSGNSRIHTASLPDSLKIKFAWSEMQRSSESNGPLRESPVVTSFIQDDGSLSERCES
jgi:hypothetical protein